jgi:hypothetical protein
MLIAQHRRPAPPFCLLGDYLKLVALPVELVDEGLLRWATLWAAKSVHQALSTVEGA